tara:strand:- start:9092 stop:10006 length:915 start_codon:yes stop_codon:yes gene_type:complete
MLPFPKVLRIEPASKCNLACMHCPTGTIEMAREVMSTETIQKVLIDIEKNKEKIKTIVLYHGGEPFLNKNFFYMIEEIKKIDKNFYIKTVSNGTVLNEKIIQKIVDSNIDLIEFSLDGDSAQDSEKIRRKSSTTKIVKNIKDLLKLKKNISKSKPDIRICSTQFFKDKKAVKKNEIPKTSNWILELFENEDVTFKNFFAMQWPAMTDKSDGFEKVTIENEDDKNYCDHVINTLTIRANGEVVPCCYDLTTELSMGNITNDSLEDIWNNSKYNKLRNSINSKKYISICNNCNVVRPSVFLIRNSK